MPKVQKNLSTQESRDYWSSVDKMLGKDRILTYSPNHELEVGDLVEKYERATNFIDTGTMRLGIVVDKKVNKEYKNVYQIYWKGANQLLSLNQIQVNDYGIRKVELSGSINA